MSVCVCVRARSRTRVCVCLCECECERERKSWWFGKGVNRLGTGDNSTNHAPWVCRNGNSHYFLVVSLAALALKNRCKYVLTSAAAAKKKKRWWWWGEGRGGREKKDFRGYTHLLTHLESRSVFSVEAKGGQLCMYVITPPPKKKKKKLHSFCCILFMSQVRNHIHFSFLQKSSYFFLMVSVYGLKWLFI